MSASFRFELVSPERLVFSGDVQSVILPGSEGQMTILAGHAPLIATLKVGIIRVTSASGEVSDVLVYGGFAEINPQGLTVLAEQAEPAGDVNSASLETLAQNARTDIGDAKTDSARLVAEQKLQRILDAKEALANLKSPAAAH